MLAGRQLPWQQAPPVTEETVIAVPEGWPEGAPPPPIANWQLWRRGRAPVEEMREWVAQAQVALAADIAGEPSDPPATKVLPQEEMEDWARPYDWDQSDENDVWPLHLDVRPGSLRELSANGTSADFFATWGAKLPWPDREMLSQAGGVGVLSGARMRRDTVLMYHHQGLRRQPDKAVELIQAEERAGRVTLGTSLPRIVPGRLVAYNVAEQPKWKTTAEDELIEKMKYRVTTDDSIAAAGSDSRNDSIARDSWPDPNLCAPQQLGEAIAIMQTARTPPATLREAAQLVHEAAAQQGVRLSQQTAERIALWALDLSDAYRVLAVHFSELWTQGFIWVDGARINLRCLFGTAHMVGFFQRVSLFVLAVAQHLIAEYDAAVPPSAAVRRWMQRRGQRVAGYQMMYLDDALAAAFLAPGARLKGAHRTSATLAGVESTPQAHQRITAQTFRRAGWDVNPSKFQLGFDIEALGIQADTGDGPEGGGVGELRCPEAKRRGLIVDLSRLLPQKKGGAAAAARATPRGPVDRAVGRLGNLSQVEPAGAAYLAPLFAVVSAVRAGGDRPRKLHLHGKGDTQRAVQDALGWWVSALERGLSVPLAPRRVFPRLGEPGVLATFSDAAGEEGTGIGGWSPVRWQGEEAARFLYLEHRWPEWLERELRGNGVSMPAGEAGGIFAIVIAAVERVPGVTHVYIFTDCAAAADAINSAASGSPQINLLLMWFLGHVRGIQLLAIHQPGKRNRAADGLSRDGRGGETVATVLAEAAGAGMRVEELAVPEGLWAAFRQAAAQPQRSTRARLALHETAA